MNRCSSCRERVDPDVEMCTRCVAVRSPAPPDASSSDELLERLRDAIDVPE